jgi:hypothetical protein
MSIKKISVTENATFLGEPRLGFIVTPEPKSLPEAAELSGLFAAAPEMLEALKVAYRSMEHRQGDCYSNDYMGKCCCGKDVVKRAICKAEGRE